MATVIKRNGNSEAFDPNKIRGAIEKATIGAGLALQRRKEIIDKVAEKTITAAGEKGEITTNALREQILEQLETVERSVFDSWRRFDKRYKGTETR